MIEDKQQIFLEYVNLFSKLNKEQKCNEILEKQKVILEFLIKYANEKNIQYKLLTKDDLVVYLSQPEIVVLKKTKKSENEIDIKPWIYELKLTDEGLFMKVAQGSASNLKPDLVVSSLFNYLQKDIPSLITYQREEMYCMVGDKLVPLDEIGETIE